MAPARRAGPQPPSAATLHRGSAFHAHDLTERVHDLDEIALGLHHRVDGLVCARRLVDDVGVLAALDTRGSSRVVGEGEASLRLAAGHRASGAVTAALEALGVAAPAHDVRTSPHAARDDAEIASARSHRSL